VEKEIKKSAAMYFSNVVIHVTNKAKELIPEEEEGRSGNLWSFMERI